MADVNEIQLWEWCKTHGDYAGYLMRYPNGIFAAEAKSFIKGENPSTSELSTITEQPEEDYARMCVVGKNNKLGETFDIDSSSETEDETKEFQAIRSTEDYKAFLKKYPNSKYAVTIREIIKKREAREREREDQEKARREAWKKERTDKEDLQKCKTIEDYQRFIETHPGSKSLKDAQTHLDALKAEPVQLTLFLLCNLLSIATVIIGLYINNIKFIGVALIVCGVLEGIVYLASVEKWKHYESNGYLTFSAFFLFIIGAIVCFRLFVAKP